MSLDLPVEELARLGPLDVKSLSVEEICCLAFPSVITPSSLANNRAEFRRQQRRRAEFRRHVLLATDSGELETEKREISPPVQRTRTSPQCGFGSIEWASEFGSRAKRPEPPKPKVDVRVGRESFAAWLPTAEAAVLLPDDHLLDAWIGRSTPETPPRNNSTLPAMTPNVPQGDAATECSSGTDGQQTQESRADGLRREIRAEKAKGNPAFKQTVAKRHGITRQRLDQIIKPKRKKTRPLDTE